MTAKTQVSRVAISYLFIAGTELATHWILTWRHSLPLLRFYLLSNAAGNSGICLFIDFLIPACSLGYWNNRFGKQGSLRVARRCVIPLAGGVVALYPLYNALIKPVSPVWWWPRSAAGVISMLALHLLTGAVVIYSFTSRMNRQSPAKA